MGSLCLSHNLVQIVNKDHLSYWKNSRYLDPLIYHLLKSEKMASQVPAEPPQNVTITPLLKRLWPSPGEAKVTPDEIADAIGHIFTNQLSEVQTGALLTCLHFTGWDRRADVIAKCAEAMRAAASKIDRDELAKVVKARGKPEGAYKGGLVSYVKFVLRCYCCSFS